MVVPILQGFDSVKLKTNVEIGGTDQLFNFGITRDMQRIHGQEPEACILMPIINGTDGRKMSKSFNNCIFINDAPSDAFGKTMSISDELMHEWLPVFFEESIEKQTNPMVLKKKLAFVITKEIWSEELAIEAREHFESVIQNKNLPTEMMEVQAGEIINIVKKLRNCSKSEAMRLLKSGAVSVKTSIEDPFDFTKITGEMPFLKPGIIVKVGKRDFAKII